MSLLTLQYEWDCYAWRCNYIQPLKINIYSLFLKYHVAVESSYYKSLSFVIYQLQLETEPCPSDNMHTHNVSLISKACRVSAYVLNSHTSYVHHVNEFWSWYFQPCCNMDCCPFGVLCTHFDTVIAIFFSTNMYVLIVLAGVSHDVKSACDRLLFRIMISWWYKCPASAIKLTTTQADKKTWGKFVLKKLLPNHVHTRKKTAQYLATFVKH